MEKKLVLNIMKALKNKTFVNELYEFQNKIKFILINYGTYLPCNRFDVGNSIEFLIEDLFKSLLPNYKIISKTNNVRIDLSINDVELSIKYSKSGNITLHNSNSQINKDLNFHNLILLTPNYLFIIMNKILNEYNINISEYLINKGDSLKLNRKILKELITINYPNYINININIDAQLCKNKSCARLFYYQVLNEYYKNNKLNNNNLKEITNINKMKINLLENEIKENEIKENEIKENEIKENKLKFIDLFCGIGGFHQALKILDFECVFACDIDKECRFIYKKNYNILPESDIKNVIISKIPKFDILCAGFPCQPFSKAGNQNGFNDHRGNLFYNICDIIEYHKPKYIILENVRNLLSHDKGNTWKIIKEKLEELKYNTYEEPLILNCLHFGIPQNRERVIILCKRKDLTNLPPKPILNKKLITKNGLLSIIQQNDIDNDKYKLTKKLQVCEKIWNNFLHLLDEKKITIPKFPIWTDWWTKNIKQLDNNDSELYNKYKNWIDKNILFYKNNNEFLKLWLLNSRKEILWKGSLRKLEWQVKGNYKNLKDTLWSTRGSGIRVKDPNYSPTLVAMTSMIPIYGPESRYLSPKECSRLQSFPDNFIIHPNLKIAYKQFGNSVNVIMIKCCAEFLILNKPFFNNKNYILKEIKTDDENYILKEIKTDDENYTLKEIKIDENINIEFVESIKRKFLNKKVYELKQICKFYGIKRYSKLKKNQIIKLLIENNIIDDKI